jgi:hypothetical protein
MKSKLGYIPSVHTEDHKVFGAANQIGGTPLVADGNWTPFLPPLTEEQDEGIEAYCCVSEALTNALYMLANRQWNDTRVWSARYLAWASGTYAKMGNDPMTVLETLKTKGVCLESDWPNSPDLKTLEEFYADPPQAIQEKALEYIAEFAPDGEWVNADPISMMAALPYSIFTNAGYAWIADSQGYYMSPPNSEPCHDFVTYNGNQNICWSIMDSYIPDTKLLEWNYQFSDVMRYSLVKNIGNTPAEQSAWQKFLSYMNEILGIFGSRTFGAARSPQFAALSREMIKEADGLCGFGLHKPTLLNPLNTHHVDAFHNKPKLELVKSNLFVVCRFHHYAHCHFFNWKDINPNCREDAAMFNEELQAHRKTL